LFGLGATPPPPGRSLDGEIIDCPKSAASPKQTEFWAVIRKHVPAAATKAHALDLHGIFIALCHRITPG
jgi:hypothetical protein